jgi:hypothetical protein
MRKRKGACGIFWEGGKLRERHHLQDQGVDGSIILKWIFKKYEEYVDCIDLA